MDVDDMDFDLPEDAIESDSVEAIQKLKLDGQSGPDLSEWKSSLVIYPAYFDSRKTVKQGRRLPKKYSINTQVDKDGIPLTHLHLARACDRLGLEFLVEEHKRYTRDYFGYGRIRVKFNKKTGFKNMKNKHDLLVELAKLLPQIQQEQLDTLRQKAANAKPSTDPKNIPPPKSYTKPLSVELFQYAMNPQINEMLKYGHGFLPLADMRPKTSQQAKKSAPAAPAKQTGRTGNKKRNKKKK